MRRYRVPVVETRRYLVEVEADSPDAAVEAALETSSETWELNDAQVDADPDEVEVLVGKHWLVHDEDDEEDPDDKR